MGWLATPTANGKWAVRKSDAARASKFFFEKDDAKDYAARRAQEDQTSVTIHRKDGTVEEQFTPGDDSDPAPAPVSLSTDDADTALYVQPDTLDRLMAQERITISSVDQETIVSFSTSDPIHPGRTVLTSREITPNAVHTRRWQAEEGRYIFEYVGDI